jgi:hypothetical protein
VDISDFGGAIAVAIVVLVLFIVIYLSVRVVNE